MKAELDRLDGLLNRDVTILRDRIEEANRQYTTARYMYIHVVLRGLMSIEMKMCMLASFFQQVPVKILASLFAVVS